MADVKQQSRSYRSPRREAQARATRAAIVEAAGRRFVDDGYAATTIDAIAAEAEVAPATVYGAFGNKRTLFAAAIDASVTGDLEEVPLAARDWVEDLRSIPDVGARVRAMFAGLRAVFERTAGFERVLREAASSDPEIADLAAEIRRRQRQDATVFRSLFVGDDPVFAGLSAERDRDAIWALTGIHTYRLLVDDCGWSPGEWERWAVALVERLLER